MLITIRRFKILFSLIENKMNQKSLLYSVLIATVMLGAGSIAFAIAETNDTASEDMGISFEESPEGLVISSSFFIYEFEYTLPDLL